MGSIVTRSSKRLDPTGLLNKLVINTTDITEVYRLRNTSEFSTVTLNIMNTSFSKTNIKVWVTTIGKSPELIDIIEPGLELSTTGVYFRSGLVMSYGEAIFVQSTQVPIVIRVEGFENVIPH